MNMELQLAACPTCQAPNAPAVKFCAQCGTSLAASAAAVGAAAPMAAAPPPVAAPPMPPIATTADPLARVHTALADMSATITGGDGLTTVDFVFAAGDAAYRGPVPIYFAGTVTAAPGTTRPYAVATKMLPKSAATLLGMWLIGVVIAGFLPRAAMSNDMYIGWIAVSLPVMIWIVLSAAPKRQSRRLEKILNGEAVPSNVPAAAPAAASAPAGGDVFSQLEKLAQLQATGLLTADDVAVKKAELLSRI